MAIDYMFHVYDLGDDNSDLTTQDIDEALQGYTRKQHEGLTPRLFLEISIDDELDTKDFLLKSPEVSKNEGGEIYETPIKIKVVLETTSENNVVYLERLDNQVTVVIRSFYETPGSDMHNIAYNFAYFLAAFLGVDFTEKNYQ